jgi:hypothetical protein
MAMTNSSPRLPRYRSPGLPEIPSAPSRSRALKIRGGVGYVPVRFEGLKSIAGYKLFEKTGDKLVPLDQSLHGNDFWQTGYDAGTQTYSLSFNLPLDGKPTSEWLVTKGE